MGEPQAQEASFGHRGQTFTVRANKDGKYDVIYNGMVLRKNSKGVDSACRSAAKWIDKWVQGLSTVAEKPKKEQKESKK
jgi:hypothetical protein